MQPRLHHLRRAGVGSAALAVTILATACGSSQPTAGSGGSANSTELKFAQCMRSHGISDYPDPKGSGGTQIQMVGHPGGSSTIKINGVKIDASAPAFTRAQKACQTYQPQGPVVSASQLTAVRRQTLKMARCMRAHGVPNFPDPKVTPGPNGRGINVQSSIQAGKVNPNSPAFVAASKICGGPGKVLTKPGA